MVEPNKKPEDQEGGTPTPGGSGKSYDLGSETRQYLISVRPEIARGAGLQAGGVQGVIGQLKATGVDVEVVKTLKPRRPRPTLGVWGAPGGMTTTPEIVVARLNAEDGERLREQWATTGVLVEPDRYLQYGAAPRALEAVRMPTLANSVTRLNLTPTKVRLKVVGRDNQGLPNVPVVVYGDGPPAEGITNKTGAVTLDLYSLRGGRAQALIVQPDQDYWDLVLREPVLHESEVNVVRLRSYSETVPGWGVGPSLSWGQDVMGHARLDARMTGSGAKVAIVDSGCDNTHPLLRHVQRGLDLTTEKTTNWDVDPYAHGTHCAGIIAAAEETAGVRGFAPDAEVHVFKVFPGGRYSDLIETLEECIDRNIDVVNLSLGADEYSYHVEQKILEARDHGVACVVAAGNSGGDVQYPASSPWTLGVGAVGRLDEFPLDSTHTATLTRYRAPDGMYSPGFTCHGPGVDVCAPGVAVISTVPGDGFKAMDGTSMAATHVSGIAALLVAHHPVFRNGPGRARTSQRVEWLFGLLRQGAVSYAFGDRAGAGMPTVMPLATVDMAGRYGGSYAQQPAGRQRTAMAPVPHGSHYGSPGHQAR